MSNVSRGTLIIHNFFVVKVTYIFLCNMYIVDVLFHVIFFCLVVDKLILLFLCANIYLLVL